MPVSASQGIRWTSRINADGTDSNARHARWNVAVTSHDAPGPWPPPTRSCRLGNSRRPVWIAWILRAGADGSTTVIRVPIGCRSPTPEIDVARRDGEDRLVDGRRHGEGQAARLRSVVAMIRLALSRWRHESVRVDQSDVLVGRAARNPLERGRSEVPSRKRRQFE